MAETIFNLIIIFGTTLAVLGALCFMQLIFWIVEKIFPGFTDKVEEIFFS